MVVWRRIEAERRMEDAIRMENRRRQKAFLMLMALLTIVISINVLVHLSLKEKMKSKEQEFVLVGNLQNIHYIETYDDLRNFSHLYNGSTVLRNVNVLVTTGLIFDNLFKKKEKFAVIPSSNHTSSYRCDECDDREDHIFTSYAVTKYVLDDKNYVWSRVGKQFTENWNKRSSFQKDFIQSYILFEVEDLTDLRLNLEFFDPAHHYITAIRFDSTKTTFRDVRYHVHVYAPKKTVKVSSSKISLIQKQKESVTTGHHWIFAVGQTEMTDWDKKSVDNLCKLILGKNIYVSYVKI